MGVPVATAEGRFRKPLSKRMTMYSPSGAPGSLRVQVADRKCRAVRGPSGVRAALMASVQPDEGNGERGAQAWPPQA